MSIIQISKIQQRSGNLVDLPQLSEAEFGWASDTKRLFIGKTTPNENVEVLTSYSLINYSQINGAVGNLNISNVSIADGQVLAYDGNNWVNRGGNAGGLISLGNVSNVKISGGAIGYVLETDGLGNLSWAPKGTLYTNIIGLSNATPIVMTVANTTPYSNDLEITISGVEGNANANVNGQTFYVQLANDYPTSGNVALFTSPNGSGPANGTGLIYTNSPNAIATAITAGGGSGSLLAGGSDTQIQYNDTNLLQGSADFTYNNSTKLLTLNGNASVGNVSATGVITATQLTSNIATGTSPLTVTSTTRVANLNVSYSNVSDFNVVTNRNTGTFFPVFVNSSATGNRSLSSNANISFNAATGQLAATSLSGNLSTAAQPNITSLGTLTSLGVSGNITAANITANTGVFTGNASGLSEINASNLSSGTVPTARLSGSYPISVTSATTAGTVTTAAQPNITSVGTLTSLGVSGNITAANITANTGIFTGNGSALTAINASNLASGTVPSARLTGSYAISVTSATTAGTVTTAAQPNITSVGTLSSLTVSGNANVGNIGATNFVGSGASLTSLNASNLSTGTVPSARLSGTYTITVSGAATTAGTVTTAAQPNITSVGTLISLGVTGNVTAGNVYANSGIIGSGTILTPVLTTGANTTAGSITGNWTLTAGSRMEATYADLAEYYEADAEYEPGTVLMFGGDKEVTLADDGTSKVAGVVSTNPAYVMNSTCPGLLTAVALQGRVPCKVRGKISKGDMLISGGHGFARPNQFPAMGTVIGKALQDFDGYEGVIEVAVGRL